MTETILVFRAKKTHQKGGSRYGSNTHEEDDLETNHELTELKTLQNLFCSINCFIFVVF